MNFDKVANEVLAQMDFKVSSDQARLLVLIASLRGLAFAIGRAKPTLIERALSRMGLYHRFNVKLVETALHVIGRGLLEVVANADSRDAIIGAAWEEAAKAVQLDHEQNLRKEATSHQPS